MMGHISVLANEVLEYSEILKNNNNTTALDVTFGLGGHSSLILEKYPNVAIYTIDKDETTRLEAIKKFEIYGSRFHSAKLCFSDLDQLEQVFNSQKELKFDLILADLGISSVQLDNPKRGLSFKSDSKLDMRLDQSQKLTADDVLNKYSERDLFLVFARGGVGSKSKALARAICNDRPINGTKDFHKICNSVLRTKKDQGKPGDLATVPFQAVRIEVNNEFQNLKSFLHEALKRLKVNGRLLVISFHSLEDKITAGGMRWWSSLRGKGLHKEDLPLGHLITRKAIKPSEEELKANSRSRSALLRVFERNENPIWSEREIIPERF